ncbi:MAG: hypothetical protein AB4352_19470 [Hormoscilla sp.]
MFGQIVNGRTGTTPSASRLFQYEVTGLSQNLETDLHGLSHQVECDPDDDSALQPDE